MEKEKIDDIIKVGVDGRWGQVLDIKKDNWGLSLRELECVHPFLLPYIEKKFEIKKESIQHVIRYSSRNPNQLKQLTRVYIIFAYKVYQVLNDIPSCLKRVVYECASPDSRSNLLIIFLDNEYAALNKKLQEKGGDFNKLPNEEYNEDFAKNLKVERMPVKGLEGLKEEESLHELLIGHDHGFSLETELPESEIVVWGKTSIIRYDDYDLSQMVPDFKHSYTMAFKFFFETDYDKWVKKLKEKLDPVGINIESIFRQKELRKKAEKLKYKELFQNRFIFFKDQYNHLKEFLLEQKQKESTNLFIVGYFRRLKPESLPENLTDVLFKFMGKFFCRGSDPNIFASLSYTPPLIQYLFSRFYSMKNYNTTFVIELINELYACEIERTGLTDDMEELLIEELQLGSEDSEYAPKGKSDSFKRLEKVYIKHGKNVDHIYRDLSDSVQDFSLPT